MLELKQQKKLKLGKYPYTYVRAIVMKSMLFRKRDYDKMLKMSFGEIAKYLQESHYRNEINEFAREYSGADLLEIALNRNLAESFKKLMRISPFELSLLIKEYAKRKDVEDIKTIIRGKFTNMDEKKVLSSITAAGTLSYSFLASLYRKESIEEILKSIKLADFSLFEEGLRELNEKNNPVAIENAFDKYYYSQLMQFSRILPAEGELFRKFLLMEVEILNILTILRMKKAKLDKNATKKFLIFSGDNIKDARILKLAELDNIEEVSIFLGKAGYKNAFQKGIEEFNRSGSLITLETEIYKHLLNQSILLLHQHPLSVDVILGYMFAKDIEVRNLKIIIKGRQLGLKENFIESQLVY